MVDLYCIPSKCHVCGKDFKARYNLAGRAKVCTLKEHVCKLRVDERVDGRRKVISCIDGCCRSKYKKALASMAASPIDSRKYLSDHEYDLVLDETRKLGDPMGIALRFILETGCRLGEVLLIKREHVDIRGGKLSVVRIPTLKKAGHPILPVHMDNDGLFVPELSRYLKGAISGEPLFRLSKRTVQRTFERILDKVKPERSGLVHLLRHTRASRLSRSGLQPNVIRSEMRWASIELLKTYSHSSEDEVAEAFGAIRKARGTE